MADLTGKLPTEIDSQQRFIQAAPATPSPLTSIFDFAGNVAEVANKAWTTLDRAAKERNAGARAAADEAAKNSAIKFIAGGILSDSSAAPQPNVPPASIDAYNSSKPLASSAAASQTAASQGKIDPSMAQARSLSIFRQALAANPGHEFAVFQAFKEAGVDNMMMQQYNNSEKAQESDQTAQQDAMHSLQKDAVNKYGYTDFFQRPQSEQATILATVGQLNASETDLDAKTKLASLTLQQNQLTDSQRTIVQKQQSSSLTQSMSTYMNQNFGNISKMMINMLGDPTLANQPGRMEQLQSHLMSVTLPSLDLAYNTKIAPMLGTLTPEDRSTLDAQYKGMRQSLVDMISGPQSVVEMNKRVLENISNSYGIDYAKSAPLLMRLQKLIGPQAIGVLLSPSVTGNKPLMDMLGSELNDVMRDPTKMPSFTEFVQSLNGSVDPSTWDPQKSRAMAPASLAATNSLAKDAASSNGTDKQAHLALVNSIKQTAGVAVDVVPQWGFGNVLMQGKSLNTAGVTRALFNTTANPQERIDAIHSWLPATTKTYLTLQQLTPSDKYYSAKLDPHTLQWTAAWNGQKVPQGLDGNAADRAAFSVAHTAPNMYDFIDGKNPAPMIKPTPSTAVLEQVSTLNSMLNNLSVVGSKGYDDSIKGASYQEARKYFATGEIPASLQKQATTTKGGKTPEQNVDDAVSHMLDFVNHLDTSGNVPSGKAREIGPSPLAPAIGASAQKYNVPPTIAAALFNTETGGGKNHHDSSKGAVGPGQIMPATAAGYGVSDLHGMKDEENVDLALHILSDNYKKTGNWADALSMYHSGHDLKTAAAHNMTDGHMKTTDYVATTMAAASSISPDNLKKYGYVRY